MQNFLYKNYHLKYGFEKTCLQLKILFAEFWGSKIFPTKKWAQKDLGGMNQGGGWKSPKKKIAKKGITVAKIFFEEIFFWKKIENEIYCWGR